MYSRKISAKQEIIINISIILLLVSVGLQCKDLFIKDDNYTVNYEYVNIKDMSKSNVTSKVDNKNIVDNLLSGNSITNNLGSVEEVSLKKNENLESVDLPVQNNSVASVPAPQIWYLPTELGRISQAPRYGHNSYDITSPRGTGETIHPVANGIISSIYTDSAGALIVTVLHNVDGRKYTSQYVHLSSYAPGIYVGMPVTINDALGQMGTTGNSTGVHLHITVMDCALFDPEDPNCNNLGNWFNYANRRFTEEYIGLGTVMYVPYEWSSR